MTIRSMTGFGQGSAESAGIRVSVELRGLNNRYTDLRLRASPELGAEGEAALRRRILDRVRRGRIEATVRAERSDGSAGRPILQTDLLEEVLAAVSRLASEHGLDARPDPAAILAVPGMFRVPSFELLWTDEQRAVFERAVDTALEAFDADREREGELLRTDLLGRARAMQRDAAGARERAAQVPGMLRDRLLQRLQGLGGAVEIDPGRLAQEAAILAERGDVTEELVRLEGHLSRMVELLERSDGEPLGKRLEFLLQEMQREANTACSKAADLELTRLALAIKLEVEKCREQAMNVE